MLKLFPKNLPPMAVSAALYVALMVALYMTQKLSLLLAVLLGIAGLMIILIAYNSRANEQHTALLNQLYNRLDAKGFLRAYEPFLNVKVRNPNLYLLIRLHLSNAYCALGRFDDAIRVLESVEYRAKKPEQQTLARFSVASNLCYCHEQKGDVAAAQAALDTLQAALRELEAFEEKKPEKRRMHFSIALNEECLRVLKGEPADIDALKEQVRMSRDKALSRVTTALWVARAELAVDKRTDAQTLLTKIARMAPDLYPGQAAQAMLHELESAEKK